MAERLPELLEAGVSMVGGCCGTTPEHIAAFRPIEIESVLLAVLDEFRLAVVVQPGIAADALAFQDIALGVREDRSSERPRFERHHREALEIRRHDQQLGPGNRVEFVHVFEEAQIPHAWMRGNFEQRAAN